MVLQNRCPNCHQKITQIANGCPHCQWSFAEAIEESTTVENSEIPLMPETERPESATKMHIDAALDSIERNDHASAIESINRALVSAEMIDLAECYSLRGFVNLQLQEYQAAIDDCCEAMRQRGEDPETLKWRAAAYGELGHWRLAFDDLTSARRIARDPEPYDKLQAAFSEPALESYRQRVKNGESGPELFCERGQVYATIGNLANARRDYKLALDENPEFDRALIGIAELELAEENFDEAEKLASQTLMVTQEFRTRALQIRAQAIARSGDFKRAVKDIDLLRERAGDTAEGLVECAKLRELIGDLAGAIDDLTLSIQINSYHAGAFRMRGALYQRLHNEELAAKDYASYLELVPSDDKVQLDLAQVNLDRNKLGEALYGFNSILKKDDINPAAYLGRAQVHLRLDDLESAEDDCQKVIRLHARNSDAYTTRGKILSAATKHEKPDPDAAFENSSATLAEAEVCFGKAIELIDESDSPKLAENYYLRGITRYEQQKFFNAESDFKNAVQLRPKHPGSYVWCAAVAAKLENWSGAIDYLQQAIKLRPSASKQYRTLGKPVAEKAIAYYDKQIERGNHEPTVYECRGMAFHFLGRRDLAIDDLTQTLENNPDSHATRIRRAELFLGQGNTKEAIRELTRIIKDESANHHARYHRAIALSQSNKLEKAQRDIEKAIEQDENHAQYWVFRGDLLFRKNQFSGAIASYDKAISIDPTDYVALNQRGNCWLRLGKPLRAISDFSQSLESYPRQPSIVALRGTAFMRNKQYELANHDFEVALTHDQTLIKAYCGRANCFANLGEFENGLIWLTKQIQRFPKGRQLAELLMARGKIYYQMGRFAPAAADFTLVIDLERSNPIADAAARCARAVALVQNGQLVRAEKEFRKVLKEVPDHDGARQAADWLNKGEGPRPSILSPPERTVSPTRPPAQFQQVTLGRRIEDRKPESPPFDLWIIRTRENREYGPISRKMLDNWIAEGRVDPNAKLLRSGWPKWKRALVVYPEMVRQSN